MPALRSRLIAIGLAFGVAVGVTVAFVVDLSCPPNDRLAARCYLGAVQLYKAHVSPRLAGHVRCRFSPTCSEYSREAVARFGLVRGLVLTVQRLARCRKSTPIGTVDPVPIRRERQGKGRSQAPEKLVFEHP